MLDKGNLIVYVEDGILLGYCEFWRISFEQFGKLICHEKFIAPFENTTDGEICYVANAWIHPDHRQGVVYKRLKSKFFRLNCRCKYFVGQALRKKTQPVKVFKRSGLRSRLFKEGDM